MEWIEIIVPVAVALVWEHWLGSTNKVEASNTSQFILEIIKKIKGRKNGGQ